MQWDIGGYANVRGGDALRNPILGCICTVADKNHPHIRGLWRPDGSRAVGDYENVEPKTPRHAVDFLAHRARITIDVNVSQLPARFLLNP